jgi:hypothetical protein
MKLAIAALALACSFTFACAGTASDGTVGPQGPAGPSGPATTPVPVSTPGTSTSSGPTSGGRITIKRTRYVGTDGSSTTPSESSYHDEMLNLDCIILPAADGVMRCLPISFSANASGTFSDAACTTPLVMVYDPTGCAPVPPYAFQLANVTQACVAASSVWRMFPTGAEYLTTGPIFSGSPGSCSKGTRPTGYRFFTIGAELPASNFVAFTLQTL